MIQIGITKMYDAQEIADLLGITPQTVRIYLSKGQIKGKKIGAKWHASEEALQEYLNDPDTAKGSR